MQYYVFKITQPTPILKNLEFLGSFEKFKGANVFTRSKRAELPLDSGITIKMVHASSQLEAEETLQTKREEVVVMEWEK